MDKKIFIALPVLNELDYIEQCINSIKQQTYKNFELWVCINQPDYWWTERDKIHICRNNVQTLEYLQSIKDFKIVIIDRCSQGKGWDYSKKSQMGVGIARQTLMESINKVALSDDIIISLDADTQFNSNYFSSIVENFKKHPEAIALSVPYYHNLTKDNDLDRAILHYEIYMRYYVINLHRINSIYSFTSLGSAFAVPIKSYRLVGGITPKYSGEDFYFLQKLVKTGKVLVWNPEKVYPAARLSDRVGFGTGPALIKGIAGDWKSYPIYDYKLFDDIYETYQELPKLFTQDISTKVIDFMSTQFKPKNFWEPIRKTHSKSQERFIRAMHEKIDSLRILQYLKINQKSNDNDEKNLINFIKNFYGEEALTNLEINENNFSFNKTSIKKLNNLRNFLQKIEEDYQRKKLYSSAM
jgi:glycosyltransferase involved in cell wall biosynthesis